MRLIFLGSPSFALPTLEALRAAGHDIALVVSQPDRPAGRGRQAAPPPVAAYAREHGLPLWQTSTLRGTQAEERLRAVGVEAMALAAFAALVPGNVLDLAPILNVHPSLLPRWRGAAPIQAALLAGDTLTGVSIIRLVAAMDAGPILLQQRLAISPDDDYLTLEPRLAQLGARMLVQALAEQAPGQPQDDSRATYCKKIAREDAAIDWSRPAEEIWNQIRAYRGWPQAFTSWEGKLLKVLRARATERGVQGGAAPPGNGPTGPGAVRVADGWPLVATGDGELRLLEVVLEGRKPQSGAELLRGYPRLNGAVLGT
ncbi:MAG TPA: methionyl-tRNA formyltransferase [Chloroflexota bacterium]|nr:methionyl-tRNA formyltransferase [Chloroflexota bacterium]